MTPLTGRQLGQMKQLARGASWIAVGAVLVSVAGPSEWTEAAIGCLVALNALGITAAILQLKAEGRYGGFWPKGSSPSGLSGRGRDDGDGPADEPVPGWRTLAVASRLMPAAGGRRWLAEAESLLAELTPAQRSAAVRSYLQSAPRLAVMMWAREVLRRAQFGPRRPG